MKNTLNDIDISKNYIDLFGSVIKLALRDYQSGKRFLKLREGKELTKRERESAILTNYESARDYIFNPLYLENQLTYLGLVDKININYIRKAADGAFDFTVEEKIQKEGTLDEQQEENI